MRCLLFPAVIIASAVAHVAAGALLHGRPVEPVRTPDRVEIAVAPKPEPAPAPPAVPAPPAAPLARAMPRPTRPAARPPAPHAPPPPQVPSAPPAPADLTGVTLTNDSGAGWVTSTGDGAAIDEPVAARRASPAAPVPAAATPGPSQVVGLADLSRAPAAPDLDGALRDNYPHDARLRGIAGKAVVRARIGPDGQARVLAILGESGPGFGEACRRTLAGSRWQAPVDKHGIAVTTEITYTCRFEVGG